MPIIFIFCVNHFWFETQSLTGGWKGRTITFYLYIHLIKTKISVSSLLHQQSVITFTIGILRYPSSEEAKISYGSEFNYTIVLSLIISSPNHKKVFNLTFISYKNKKLLTKNNTLYIFLLITMRLYEENMSILWQQ